MDVWMETISKWKLVLTVDDFGQNNWNLFFGKFNVKILIRNIQIDLE
jgi:hypothetical protein